MPIYMSLLIRLHPLCRLDQANEDLSLKSRLISSRDKGQSDKNPISYPWIFKNCAIQECWDRFAGVPIRYGPIPWKVPTTGVHCFSLRDNQPYSCFSLKLLDQISKDTSSFERGRQDTGLALKGGSWANTKTAKMVVCSFFQQGRCKFGGMSPLSIEKSSR